MMPEDAVRAREQQLLDAFWMPSVQTMISRKSSITNAFVAAIIPVVVPSIDEIEESLRILEMTPADLRCAYCGDRATEWDHLRPLVKHRRPTGFISEIANLVPACGKCNQSKGNKDWRIWILSAAPLSPRGRNVPGLERRIARLESYESWRAVTPIDFEQMLGAEAWAEYWQLCDQVVESLRTSQEVANRLAARIVAHRNAENGGERRSKQNSR